jgi:hypothetical protein
MNRIPAWAKLGAQDFLHGPLHHLCRISRAPKFGHAGFPYAFLNWRRRCWLLIIVELAAIYHICFVFVFVLYVIRIAVNKTNESRSILAPYSENTFANAHFCWEQTRNLSIMTLKVRKVLLKYVVSCSEKMPIYSQHDTSHCM